MINLRKISEGGKNIRNIIYKNKVNQLSIQLVKLKHDDKRQQFSISKYYILILYSLQ